MPSAGGAFSRVMQRHNHMEAFKKIFQGKGWYILAAFAIIVAVGLGARAASFLRPVPAPRAETVMITVEPGAGLSEIAGILKTENLIRSPKAFAVVAYFTGWSRNLHPGTYEIPPRLGTTEVLERLASGLGREATVVIPEGSNVYDIDQALAARRVTPKGEFAAFALREGLEGKLFPDTYRFYFDSTPEAAAARMTEIFADRVLPLFAESDSEELRETLILASILEREVPEFEDQRIVAGLLLKRLEAGMPLQVDASVCYAKRLKTGGEDCYPVTVLDTRNSHDYNTYTNTGWPPGPIGNPGISAVKAALSPVKSPYWYYLSDPATKKTIFAKDLEEHEANRSEYLLSR